MKPQNPDAKSLEETSGSSGFFRFSQESDGMASDFEVQSPESTGALGLNCVDPPDEAIEDNACDIGCVDENFPANEGSKEENEGLSRGADIVRKIEVSGDNLSLVVDFSDSLTGVSCRNAFESSGSNLTVNVKKENGGVQLLGFVVGDIVWVSTKYRTWWPGEVVDSRTDKKKSLLVRYFEQSHVLLWRSPSQLRPINQYTECMLKQGKGKSFTRAVEKAMALLGDSLKLEMTCPCICRDNVQPEENGKLQKLKPCLIRGFSLNMMQPEEFIEQLKNVAKSSSVSEILELTVMQSRLSTFLTFLGHKKIPVDQLCEKAGKPSLVPAEMKPKKKVRQGSIKRKRPADKNKELSSISGMETQVSGPENNVVTIDVEIQKASRSRDRKRSKYLDDIYETQFKNNSILGTRKYLAKSRIGPLSVLSAMDSVPGTHEFSANYSHESISVQTLSEKAPEADALNIPAVPDLNSGSTTLNVVEPDHLQSRNTWVLPEVSRLGGETRSMMLNFQVTDPCLTDNISGAGVVFLQPGSDMNLNMSNTDLLTHFTNPKQKTRKWKRKRIEEPLLATQTAAGIPGLNGVTLDATSPLPREKPVQCRQRRKKEELPNRETKGTTILLMKFTSGVSMPSKDDLTSTFSGFGPLDATETHILTDSGSAQVAFMSSGDAIEAVKSLVKSNPFGETLLSFRLQQRSAISGKNVAPRMPVISISPASRRCEPPMSMEMIRQNLMMMTTMMEKSGDTLSEEMRVKLKSEISGLLEKVSSMPSSSSSSTMA